MCGGRERAWGLVLRADHWRMTPLTPPGVRTAEECGREIRIEITIEIKITSRSRSGVVERLSMRGRWDGPPLAPPS